MMETRGALLLEGIKNSDGERIAVSLADDGALRVIVTPGKIVIYFYPFDSDANVAVGDGKKAFAVPEAMNGMNLSAATAAVHTAGAVGATTDIQIRRRRAGADVDMLSTKITLSVAEEHASDGIINAANDHIATGDRIYVDVDAINTTAPKGLSVTLAFSFPS